MGAGVPEAGVSRLSIDFIIRLLPGPVGQIIDVLSGKSVVLIQNLAQILHFSAAHLENGVKHGVVDGVVEPLPLPAFQVAFLYQEEQIYPGRTQVAVEVRLLSIAIASFDLFWVID